MSAVNQTVARYGVDRTPSAMPLHCKGTRSALRIVLRRLMAAPPMFVRTDPTTSGRCTIISVAEITRYSRYIQADRVWEAAIMMKPMVKQTSEMK
jgi:hypothetical protein